MKEEVDFKGYVETPLGENEVLLSFHNDSGEEKFEEWWCMEGKKMFDKFCEEWEE